MEADGVTVTYYSPSTLAQTPIRDIGETRRWAMRKSAPAVNRCGGFALCEFIAAWMKADGSLLA
jgi:hypothetical protein